MEPLSLGIIASAITIIGAIFGVGWKLHKEFADSKEAFATQLQTISDKFSDKLSDFNNVLNTVTTSLEKLLVKSEERWTRVDVNSALITDIEKRVREIESRLDKAGL